MKSSPHSRQLGLSAIIVVATLFIGTAEGKKRYSDDNTSADLIENAITNSADNARDSRKNGKRKKGQRSYRRYARQLTRTLAKLSAEQQLSIFGE